MSSTYGENLKLSIFGQSHGPAIGMTLDGIPAGLEVDFDKLQAFLNRRAPGQNSWSTPRKEEDQPEFLSGILDGFTCGAPVAAVIYNKNTRSGDYANLKDCPRPGHADYTAQVKYGGFQDAAGGGHFSGRLTAPLVFAGSIARQILREKGIEIGAHVLQVGPVSDIPFDPADIPAALLRELQKEAFPVLDPAAGEAMKAEIQAARMDCDSVGGIIQCAAAGLPAGIGEPGLDCLESVISRHIFAVPAVKGISFGLGFGFASLRGSAANDQMRMKEGRAACLTNHNGGITGGISNGMPLLFQTVIKPTPSIAKPQQTVDLSAMKDAELVIHGRHDPCILSRAAVVIESAAALALAEILEGGVE